MVGNDDLLDGACTNVGVKYKPVELFSKDGKKNLRDWLLE